MTMNKIKVKHAAKVAGVKPTTLLRWIRLGELPAELIQGYVIKEEDLAAFIQRLPILSQAGRKKKQARGNS